MTNNNWEKEFIEKGAALEHDRLAKWLADNKVNYFVLIMRDAHDKRPDVMVKQEIYDKYLKKLNIWKVFDDRPSVIKMWRENGLLVEDVGNGEEF